jgi:Ca-activated chloride channel family protein
MVLANPAWLLLLLALPLPWLILRRKGYVGHSDVRLAKVGKSSAVMHLIPILLISLAWAALAVALARPQHRFMQPTSSVQARDIVVAVDKSGSMGTTFEGTVPTPQKGNTPLDQELPPTPKTPTLDNSYYGGDSSNKGHRRIDAAQAATLNFVRDRFISNSGDRIGIEVFDTDVYWSWPLTPDLKTIYRKVQFADQGVGGGTNFGETKPGPIDAAQEQFNELGQSKTRVLIMVTDGEDNLDGASFDRLLKILRDENIRLYVIGVGETLAHNDVDIIRLAQAAHGQVFRVENAGDLDKVFQTINSLETSSVQIQSSEKREELFFLFATAALILFVLGAIGEAIILNE